MKTRLNHILATFIFALTISITSCKNDNDETFEIYSGTLTVLQKDAYSNSAGKNNILWPPHTTTVFKWNNGEEVQLNHGTSPDEKDANGTSMLDEVKVYNFQGSKNDLVALEQAYIEAICDEVDGKPSNTFLSLVEAKSELSKVVLKSLGEFIAKDEHNFSHSGLTKDEVLQLLASGDVSKLIPLLQSSNMTPENIHNAFNEILKSSFAKLGHDITKFHVCNNDAELQVRLIKNFIATSKVQMPERECTGPMVYYFPE